MRATIAFGFGLMTMLASAATAQETKTIEPAKANEFEGAYVITAGEEDGKQTDEEHIKGTSVRITGDTIVVADKDDKELYVSKYTLDATKTPAAINMTQTGGPRGRKGTKAIGIIGKDGEDLKLCYAYEGGILPTSFKTKAGEKQLCFTLKKKDTK